VTSSIRKDACHLFFFIFDEAVIESFRTDPLRKDFRGLNAGKAHFSSENPPPKSTMPCPINHQPDPFGEARRKDGILVNEFEGQRVPMILRHEDLRAAAKNWQTFSSDAPMHISQPPEVDVRTVRQLPLEIDPPDHADYREIAEPFFNRAKLPEVIAQVEELVRNLLAESLGRDSIEVVRQFAIPLQSRALAVLLNMPLSEAEVWIGWGSHVFRAGDGKLHDDARSKGLALETYMSGLLDRGLAQPGDDFFSALTRSTFRGRALTREEMLGFGSIMFLGGRDTLINSISGVIGHLSKDPKALEYLREDPKRIVNASEEFFRAISPVTHLARVCPAGADVHGVQVEPGNLASLCFASANYDEAVFTSPDEVRLDRKPNPHVAFGFGPHLCLGAPHARLVVRAILKGLCEQVGNIETLQAVEKVEKEVNYRRHLAYESLTVRLSRR
jgi:cytochrome P450